MHSTGMDRQKQSGLWVVGFGLEGWPKSPRQDEAAAVVRLVWPAGCRAVRVVALLAHGPLEISRKERQGARQSGLGTAIGGLQAQIWISKVTIRPPGVRCMRFSANNGCEAEDAVWGVGAWASGCLDVWAGSEGGGCDPGLQDVKTSGIRRLSLTRDMRHGRFGVGGLCAAFRAVLCCAVVDRPLNRRSEECRVSQMASWAGRG